jgi:hypothetical protein
VNTPTFARLRGISRLLAGLTAAQSRWYSGEISE